MKTPLLLSAFLLCAALPMTQAAAWDEWSPGTISRLEFLTLALQEQGTVIEQSSRCFVDVSTQDFSSTVCTAKNKGLVTGDPIGTFRPHSAITYVEAAAIVVRARGGVVAPDVVWYRPYVQMLSQWGVGPTGQIDIFGGITHAQALEMIRGIRGTYVPPVYGGTARLRLEIDPDEDEPEPGDRVEYRIRLTNEGTADLRDIDVIAELDDQMEFHDASGNGDEYGDDVEWRNLDLRAGQRLTLTLEIEVDDDADDGDSLRLRVRADAETESDSIRVRDDDDDDNDDDDDADIRVSITETEDPVWRGQVLTYYITLENREDDDVEIDVRALLDEDLVFLSANHGGERDGSDEVRWEDLEIDEDETVTLMLTVRIDDDVQPGDTLRLEVEAADGEDVETTQVR